MSNRKARGLLRGVLDRVQDLEESISSDEGKPHLLRSLEESLGISDAIATTTDAAGAMNWDSSGDANSFDSGRWRA